VPDVEDELDRLYALPLEEFTRSRNDLARRLSRAGRGEAANEVKKLAKPSVPVWTANQLARREPGEVRALLRSAEELRKAQERALRGKGAADLRERLDEQRRAVRALARLGRDILGAEGRSVSDAIIERIAKTLDAAALDEGSRFLLRAGRLTEELEPSGFDVLAGMAPAKQTGPRGARSPSASGKREQLATARRAVQSARQAARQQARAAVDAEREAQRAESAAADARRRAQEARDRSNAAEQALAEAEAALRQAQRG
jgi:hypothetical protein